MEKGRLVMEGEEEMDVGLMDCRKLGRVGYVHRKGEDV